MGARTLGIVLASSGVRSIHSAVIIAVGALALRLVDLRVGTTFQRTDEPLTLLMALKLEAALAASSFLEVFHRLFTVFSSPWGYGNLVFTFIPLKLYDWLGIPITEFTALAPFALLGAGTVLQVYALGTYAFGPRAGLAAAIAVALLPAHIALSRTNISPIMLGLSLTTMTVLGLLRYLDTGARRDALLLGLGAALLFVTDSRAPIVLAALGLYVLVFRRDAWPRIRTLVKQPGFLVPVLLALVPVVSIQLAFIEHGQATAGYLGRYFTGKLSPGWYAGTLGHGLIESTRPALVWLVPLGVARGFIGLWRRDRSASFALVGLGLAGVFAFTVNLEPETATAYMLTLVVVVVMLGAVAVSELLDLATRAAPRAVVNLAYGLLAAGLLWALASVPPRVWDRPLLGIANDPIGLWGGIAYQNDGAKTAGWWIRTHTEPNAIVYSDLQHFAAKYYLHRPTVSPRDPRFTEHSRPPLWRSVSVLALTGTFLPTARRRGDLDGFHLAATVTHRTTPVLLIYRRHLGERATLPTESYDARFDREFGRLAALGYACIWGDDTVRPPASCW
jgi:hypothetical protein